MSEARIDSISNESNTGGPVLSGVTEFSGQQYFIPPKGTTAERPSDCPPGSIRFNTDSAHLEYWNGLQWLEFEATNDELGNQLVTNSAGGTGTRGIIGARAAPGFIQDIDYFTVATRGNGTVFGDMSTGRYTYATFASSVRGVFAGGNGQANRIESITFASTGDAIVDGNGLIEGRYHAIGCGNQTRGLAAGGVPARDSIEAVTIASLGSAIDFGNLNEPLRFPGAYASSIRGIFAGRYNPSGPHQRDTIQYVTISSQGDAQDFGDLTRTGHLKGVGSSTRAVFGSFGGPTTNTIDFITMASTGHAQDFGDMIGTGLSVGGSFSSVTRGCWAGGLPGNSNVVQSIEVASTGNTVDFGDLTQGGHGGHGMSNGHGGL